MKQKQFVVTGINQLTGQREPVTLPMGEAAARCVLERERERRHRQRNLPFARLRVERLQPIQLTLNFSEHE